MNDDSRGQIITFYSYKGGTGRSMALANIACILAERQSIDGGKGVLMIDWDLEAPGLHRYFRNYLASGKLGLSRVDASQDEKPGLIDLFHELNDRTDYYLNAAQGSPSSDQSLSKEQLAHTAIEAVDLHQYILPTTLSGLSLLKSGRFSPQKPNEYSERVNKFNWEALYQKSPHLIRILAETLAKEYAYVLIDSRTGVTDISGICTMLLPEKLVVVFTPNLQSLKGGLDLIRRATDYRQESADLRPLVVFPLVSRVEMSEPDLRHDWRFGNQDTEGYQPEFEKVLAEVYEKTGVKLDQYFDEMQIQHIPKYAYGEEIAVLIEKTWDKFSLRRSYRTFANKLIDSRSPWEGEITPDTFVESGGSAFANFIASTIDIFSLSGATKPVRSAIVVVLLGFGIWMMVSSYRQSLRADAAQTSLDMETRRSASLENQAALLQQQIQQLSGKSTTDLLKQIDDLNTTLANQSKELSDAKDEISNVNTQVADALRAKTQAQTDAKQAQNDAKQASQMATVAKSQAQACTLAIKDKQDKIARLDEELQRCQKGTPQKGQSRP